MLGTLTVANKKTHQPGPNDVYIGRPSLLGNPYHIGKDGTRDEVIAKYQHYLRWAWKHDLQVRCELRQLAQYITHGRDVTLVCWCSPQACHGDVIKEAVEGIIAKGVY